MLLTIFTPTYNRAHTLTRVFESLCAQSYQDFEWLIVDDGSTDDTAAKVAEFKHAAPFNIKYIQQANGGKHTAHNTALHYAEGDLFFTVDSDDWLPVDSAQKIRYLVDSFPEIWSEDVAGVLALKSYESSKTIGSPFTVDNTLVTLVDLENSGNGGERTVILKTAVAKSFPFPVIDGERFMGESVVYDRIGQKYTFFISNEHLTICEYQPDGLSCKPRRLMYYNPGGYAIYFAQRADLATNFKTLIKCLVQVNTFRSLYKGKTPIRKVEKHKALYYITKPLGWLLIPFYRTFGN